MLIIIVSLYILQYKYYHGITICNVRFYYKGTVVTTENVQHMGQVLFRITVCATLSFYLLV